jgi:hypothetical protein
MKLNVAFPTSANEEYLKDVTEFPHPLVVGAASGGNPSVRKVRQDP